MGNCRAYVHRTRLYRSPIAITGDKFTVQAEGHLSARNRFMEKPPPPPLRNILFAVSSIVRRWFIYVAARHYIRNDTTDRGAASGRLVLLAPSEPVVSSTDRSVVYILRNLFFAPRCSIFLRTREKLVSTGGQREELDWATRPAMTNGRRDRRLTGFGSSCLAGGRRKRRHRKQQQRCMVE